MRYKLTCLSPLLVGDGSKLAAIDYMVWKDQVSVLDQRRIFRLLAKGPRLEGYLTQLKKADKLDFASWGGFAQNFADRRVPFEHPSMSGYWERAIGESLNIPTFARGAAGPYLPGAAIKGALRTALMFSAVKPGMLKDTEQAMRAERQPRRPAEAAESQALGGPGHNRVRGVLTGDSTPVKYTGMKIYLLRVSTLQQRGPEKYALGWKQSQRGTVDGARPDDGTPIFAEMAAPGAEFTGSWEDRSGRRAASRAQVFEAANRYAAKILEIQQQYASWTGLDLVGRQVAGLQSKLGSLGPNACLLAIGWGAGLLSKTPWIDAGSDEYRQVLRHVSAFRRAIESGMPFPKTRRIVFEQNKPAALPGWALLEVD
jgi:CRISPR-associated protein Csm5